MNAFQEASKIEAESLRRLMPWLEHRAQNGHIVKTAKGRLSRELQKRYGDVFMNRQNGDVVSIELKAEVEQRHGNLFLETWSNLSRYTPGWMFTIDADILLYHFLDGPQRQELHTISFGDLRNWAFKKRNRLGTQGRIWEYPGKPQGKYKQLNDTWGRCVPINVLKMEAGLMDITYAFAEFTQSKLDQALHKDCMAEPPQEQGRLF